MSRFVIACAVGVSLGPSSAVAADSPPTKPRDIAQVRLLRAYRYPLGGALSQDWDKASSGGTFFKDHATLQSRRKLVVAIVRVTHLIGRPNLALFDSAGTRSWQYVGLTNLDNSGQAMSFENTWAECGPVDVAYFFDVEATDVTHVKIGGDDSQWGQLLDGVTAAVPLETTGPSIRPAPSSKVRALSHWRLDLDGGDDKTVYAVLLELTHVHRLYQHESDLTDARDPLANLREAQSPGRPRLVVEVDERLWEITVPPEPRIVAKRRSLLVFSIPSTWKPTFAQGLTLPPASAKPLPTATVQGIAQKLKAGVPAMRLSDCLIRQQSDVERSQLEWIAN